MSEFTKGPWEFHAHDGSVSVKGQPHNAICEGIIHEDHQVLGAEFANGDLIAASPRMYETLMDVREFYREVMLECLYNCDHNQADYWRMKFLAVEETLAIARGEHR